MAKDYTDYVAEIFENGERVFHLYHFRQTKKDEEVVAFQHNGNDYFLNKDRAVRTKWKPWKMWDRKHPLDSLYELFRSKKVGLIVYREPKVEGLKFKTVQTKIPTHYSCKICADKGVPFTTDHAPSIKTHITRKHKGAKHDMVTVTSYTVIDGRVTLPIEPYHISRIHQPSGEFR